MTLGKQAFILLLMAACSPPSFAVEIIGHRGAAHDAPENTLPSIRLGFEQGADAVEIDIHLSADGKIVASHDADTKRVSGRELRIAETHLAELRKLDVGSWKGDAFRGAVMPTLAEAIDAVPDDKLLVIEIKCCAEALPELERVLDASGKRSQTLLIAFDYETIVAAKKRLPDQPAYWLYGYSEREAKRYGIAGTEDLVRMAKSAGLDGLDVNHRGLQDGELADRLHADGMKLYVYTVNERADAERLIGIGVDGLTTDRPGWLREQLGR